MFKVTLEPTLKICDEADWEIETPMQVVTAAGEHIEIPVGFFTDLASIPRIFHSIIPVNGKHRLPAILHDYLYAIQDRERSEADALFLEAAEACGVRWTQRQAMYLAVRVGGWLPWNNNVKDKSEDLSKYLKGNGLKSLEKGTW